ncbi:MAG: FtsX-like permease family protein, partial [Rhodospirillales bacterium]
RLSGATPAMVVSLHALIMALASIVGLVIGLGTATIVAVPLLDIITARLHVPWSASDVVTQLATVATILVVGLTGTGLLALSGAARISPGAAMRNGVAGLRTDPLHAAIGTGFLVAAMAAGALSLPIPALAGLATAGLAVATGLLALAAGIMARIVARRAPRSFIGIVACQSLGNAGHAASRTVAIGIGIVGITAIVAAQSSLDHALNSELPERVPDLVLLDVQPDQVDSIRERIETTPGLGGLQANPFMRMTLTAVNGVPARDALRRADKSWVIEGDRSFSWTATPTGAELLAGSWWDADYAGPPVVSPEEDLMEAFDLKVGDVLTYGVLGRSFTSEVVNIRKEYHRTFRPEFLMLASPQPFRDAPQSWIMSLQGETDGDVDTLIRDLATAHPNVTSIDVRLIAAQVGSAIEGASLASLLVAVLLIVAGAFSLAALVASDVDSRRQEALVYALVGASRREIAAARLTEAAIIGAIAAILGGISGGIGGYFSVTEALHVAWIPGIGVILIPVALGVASSVAAGIVGGLGAAPRGRGEMVRQLTG